MSDEALDRIIEFVLQQARLPAGPDFTHRERILFICHYLKLRTFRPRSIPVELAIRAGYASPASFHGSLSAAYAHGRVGGILHRVEKGLYAFEDDFLREAKVDIQAESSPDNENDHPQAITIHSLFKQLNDEQKVALLLINDFKREIVSNGALHLRISLGHLHLSVDENEELFQLLQNAHVLESSNPGVIEVIKAKFEELIDLIQGKQEQGLVSFAVSVKSDDEFESELKLLRKQIAQLSEMEKPHHEMVEQCVSDIQRHKDHIVILEREIAGFKRLAEIACIEQEKIKVQIISLSRKKDEIMKELENRRLASVETQVKAFAESLGISEETLLKRLLYRTKRSHKTLSLQ